MNSVTYKNNELILVKSETSGKLEKLFDGPYKVIEDQGPNVVILKNNRNETIHKNRTKRFLPNDNVNS